MTFIKLWTMAVVLLLSLKTIAQEKSRRLFVGDKVPDIELTGIHNYSYKTARLSDFKGKTVILDFWNKGCTSCIADFPKMQKIQKEFKEELVILLVNDQKDQTLEALSPLFKSSPILKATNLPMIFGNAIFGNKSELFPHYAVPYHVWIDKNGIIQATTHGYDATRENIQKLIKGEQLNVVRRVDILESRDDKTNWLTYDNGLFINNLVYYRSDNFSYKHTGGNIDLSPLRQLKLGERYHSMFLKRLAAGNLAGSSNGVLKDTTGNNIGGYVRNPIMVHYGSAYDVSGCPIIIEGDEIPNLKDEYVYEYIDSNCTNASWQERYKQDLENYLGYKGTLEMRYMECYIFYRADKPLKLPKSKGGVMIYEDTQSDQGFVIQNGSLGMLISLLADRHKDKFDNPALAFDETGVDKGLTLDMTVRGDLKNIHLLNSELSKYGLGVRKEARMLPVLILRK